MTLQKTEPDKLQDHACLLYYKDFIWEETLKESGGIIVTCVIQNYTGERYVVGNNIPQAGNFTLTTQPQKCDTRRTISE